MQKCSQCSKTIYATDNPSVCLSCRMLKKSNATSVIRQKEIHSILDGYYSIPCYSLDRILQKLDDEDLKDLQYLFEEMHEQSQFAQTAYADGKEAGYDEGYSQGYNDGMDQQDFAT